MGAESSGESRPLDCTSRRRSASEESWSDSSSEGAAKASSISRSASSSWCWTELRREELRERKDGGGELGMGCEFWPAT